MIREYYIWIMVMGKKVLIIDNTIWHATSYEYLIKEGYAVDKVHSSSTGLQKLDTQAYDVVIVQERPGAESWQLCERIRDLSGIPLIVVNKQASAETCVKAINAGADYFMRKPFGPLELIARIQSLLHRTPVKQAETIVS
jgi:two-component system OmpR family response regulator